MPPRKDDIPPNTVFVVPSISPALPPKKEAIPFQMVSKKPLIPFQMPVKKPEIAVQTETAVFWIPLTAPEKKDEMPFQMPSKKVLIEVQTVFQSVPNRPRKASATPLRVFSTLVKVLLI